MLGRALASLTRRRFLLGAGAVAGAGAAVAVGVGIDRAVDTGGPVAAGGPGAAPVPSVPLGTQPAGLPARQHAWNAVLARDQYGNAVPPLYHRLLFFDVNGHPSAARARVLEAALRTLERAYPWAPAGLLFTAGWGQPYFADALHISSPIPVATALSGFELPAIDDYHLCLHLASDDEPRLAAVETALARGAPLPGADGPLDVSSALRWRETRTGFIGTGLPAERQDAGGIPAGDPVPAAAPLFMGFKSSLTRNQATEDDVTIPGGPFAGGTTMHASYMRLSLDDWYGQLSEDERVACTPPRSLSSRSPTTSPPTRKATPACSARRSAATASSATPRPRLGPGAPAGRSSCGATSTPPTAARPACTSCPCSARSRISSPPVPR